MRAVIAVAFGLMVLGFTVEAHSIDARLLLETICAYESRGSKNPEDEISWAGAVGYCQIRVGTARYFGYKGPNSKLMGSRKINMSYGMKMVILCLQKWHSTPYRIAFCYHAGMFARVPKDKAKREKLRSHRYAVAVAKRYRAAYRKRARLRRTGQAWREWTIVR